MLRPPTAPGPTGPARCAGWQDQVRTYASPAMSSQFVSPMIPRSAAPSLDATRRRVNGSSHARYATIDPVRRLL